MVIDRTQHGLNNASTTRSRAPGQYQRRPAAPGEPRTSRRQVPLRGAEQRGHEVDVVDPVDEALPSLVKPYFAYAPGQAPPKLAKLNERLLSADAYVAVTPEYNHAPVRRRFAEHDQSHQE